MKTITSREYKLILNPGRFLDRKAACNALQDLVGFLAERLGGEIKRQAKEDERRTSYLDTEDFALHKAGYAFRLRFEAGDNVHKLTLKYRDPDLILAEAASLETADGLDADEKFEEDLMPPFRSVFSRSSAVRFSEEPDVSNLARARDIFPALSALDLPGETKLATVNRFRPTEIFRKLCKIDFGTGEPVKMGLSFWYAGKATNWPLIAECAFDFACDEDTEHFDLDQVRRSNDLFRLLQKQPGWFDAEATTKTRYAYEGLK
ncbi:hypothetical protein [Roseibium sp. M-1]